MEKVQIKSNHKEELLKEYNTNMQNKDFKNLVTKLKINPNLGMLNTTNLNDVLQEQKNCANCKGLHECQNKVFGHYIYPKINDNIMDLVYIPCHYENERQRMLASKLTAKKELANASFKTIDISDKKRVKLIKWLTDFYENYDGIKNIKGLYLHGSFGSGKTYLIYALLNELKLKKKVDYIALYFPEILRTLKDDWDLFGENINKYSTVPLLLIDDIGAESVSEWSRDEVLGTILQNRMNNELPTFFTSNLTIDELETHLSETKSNVDKVKARRIIERIKQLTIDMEIITDNKRK